MSPTNPIPNNNSANVVNIENNTLPDAFAESTTGTDDTYIPKKNKDVIFGKLIRSIRTSGNNLLFAMLTNIDRYDIIDNNFVIVCSQLVNYQDLTEDKTCEILNNMLQKIDSELSFKVELEEDKTQEIIANNIKLLKGMFGKLVKFIEKK